MIKFMTGFTLLELLVALTVFAVIAVMAYSGLNTVLNAHFQIKQQATQLANLQRVFSRLSHDIEQYVQRPIRNQYGDVEPSINGTIEQLEFTRSGWRNPAQQNRSFLQRVAYHLQDNKLIRSYWFVLDQAQDSKPILMNLADNINDMQWHYLNDKLIWQTEWLNTSTRLKAIKIVLKIEGWGKIERLFQISE